MRVLFVMPSLLSCGGIETTTMNMWRGLKRLGHEVDFVCHGYEIGFFEEEVLTSSSKVFHIPVKSKNLFKTIYDFKCILKDGHYDVVHANMNATAGIYLQVAKKMGVKVLVSHSHASSMDAFTKNYFKKFVNYLEMYRTRKYSNCRLACSHEAGRWLFGDCNYEVLLNAVDANKYYYNFEIRNEVRKELNIDSNSIIIIHVASFLPVKNHEFCIKLMRGLSKKNINYKFVFVGDGETKPSIISQAKQCGLEQDALFLGQRNDVARLLQAADVFVLPSYSEGNPVSLVEAACSGLHCVLSDNVSKDVVEFFPGVIIDYLSITDYCEDWIETICQSYERVEYSDKNPCVLNIDNMVQKLLRCYNVKNDISNSSSI